MYLTALYCKSIKMSTKYKSEIETIVSKFSELETVIFQFPLTNNRISYSNQTYEDNFSVQADVVFETIPLQFNEYEYHGFPAKELWENKDMKVHEIMSLREYNEAEPKITLSDVYWKELQKEKAIRDFKIAPGNLFFNEKNQYYRKSHVDNDKTLAIESFGIGVARIVEMFLYGFVVSNFLEELGQLDGQSDKEYNDFKNILTNRGTINLTQTNIKFNITGFFFLHRLLKYVKDFKITFNELENKFENDIEEIQILKDKKGLEIKFIFDSHYFQGNVANLLSVIAVKKKHDVNYFKFTDENKYMLIHTVSQFEENVVDSLHKKTKLSEETSSRMNFENLKNIQQMKSDFWKFVDEYFYVQNNVMCFSNQFLESVQNQRSDKILSLLTNIFFVLARNSRQHSNVLPREYDLNYSILRNRCLLVFDLFKKIYNIQDERPLNLKSKSWTALDISYLGDGSCSDIRDRVLHNSYIYSTTHLNRRAEFYRWDINGKGIFKYTFEQHMILCISEMFGQSLSYTFDGQGKTFREILGGDDSSETESYGTAPSPSSSPSPPPPSSSPSSSS